VHVDVEIEARRCGVEIRKICPDARVVVFGSSIAESVRRPRDIDLLVVVPRGCDFRRLRREIMAIPRTTWPLDIIVVPGDYLSERLAESGNFYSFVFNEGVELGSQPGLSA
jgi:hypothetical protein